MRIILVISLFLLAAVVFLSQGEEPAVLTAEIPAAELPTDEDGWRERLTSLQFRVLRQQGTERPWTGAYNKHDAAGIYRCAGCGQKLFSSEHKYDSKSGWPSFYTVAGEGLVGEVEDRSHGMVRTEVICTRCKGHLGHVFRDGPAPTGLRYCINSVSLAFEAAEKPAE